MANFVAPKTMAELDALDLEDVVEGYRSTQRGDPEPGQNRGRSFWFGWRNRMIDFGEIPIDADHAALVREVVAAQRTPASPEKKE